MKKGSGNIIKYLAVVLLLAIIGFFVIIFPKSAGMDFSNVKLNMRAQISGTEESQLPTGTGEEKATSARRTKYVNSQRAEQYLQSATGDYYRGSYEDALRRLTRAQIYDPHNFGIFKLTGQIFFEKNRYKKAFNQWERATQLDNDDTTISRDIGVLKQLLRYSRTEMDKLQRSINKHPDDRIAQARLKELKETMQ